MGDRLVDFLCNHLRTFGSGMQLVGPQSLFAIGRLVPIGQIAFKARNASRQSVQLRSSLPCPENNSLDSVHFS